MIEKMQKLSLLILRSSKDLFLSELQTLGAVHLECDKSVQNDEITILKEKSGRFEKIAKYLAEVKSQIKSPLSDKSISDDEDLEKIVSSVEKIKSEIDDLNTQVDNLKKEVAQLEPWGIFDEGDITRLEKIGLQIKFFSSPKSKFDKIDKSLFPIEVISRLKGTVYFAVVADMGESISIVGANEERFPIKNSNELKDKMETLTGKKTDKTEELKEFVCYIDSLKEIVLKYEDKISYRIANANLSPEADGELLYLSGWVPERNIKDVKSFLNLKDVVFILEQPKENEEVPIKLKNNAFNKLFEPIGKMFSLPNYHEIDPTPFFAPFFTLFFGLCMGDVGYGLIILVAALVGFILIKSKGVKPFMLLGVILGIASMFSG
ncbi:MAG TPA: V-type ATPase 116kDa subunit family protein, partial [Spirochaetota bacterium]|nr:V-type ATPase 116kDa subunit family protein [Spirochaetota bacterium]